MHSSLDTDIDPNFETNASVEVSYQGRLQIQMVIGHFLRFGSKAL